MYLLAKSGFQSIGDLKENMMHEVHLYDRSVFSVSQNFCLCQAMFSKFDDKLQVRESARVRSFFLFETFVRMRMPRTTFYSGNHVWLLSHSMQLTLFMGNLRAHTYALPLLCVM